MNVGLFGEAKKIKLKNHFLNNGTTKPLNQNNMAEEAKMAIFTFAMGFLIIGIGLIYNYFNEK